MKIKFSFLFLTLMFIGIGSAFCRPDFVTLMVSAEENPMIELQAREAAINKGMPVSLISTQKMVAVVKGVENGQPLYALMTDVADIYKGAMVLYFHELSGRIDFSKSKIDYGNGRVVDNTNGFFNPVYSDNLVPLKSLLITESTHDRVYLCSIINGNVLDTAYIPSTRPQLGTPKHAIQHFNGKDILVSDQTVDVVQRFFNNGLYSNVFAPIGGTLDNNRGIAYRTNNNLLVTVGGGAGQNTVQHYDTAGNALGAFIAGNVLSPFDVLIRSNDILVSNFSGTNRISRFDLNGAFLNSFYTGSQFNVTQQLYQLPNGNIAASSFSPSSGIAILDSNGAFIKLLNGVTGNRGVWLLENGNFLTTNSAGSHEIDSATGALVRTVQLSPNFQYIDSYEIPNPQLRLTINFEACTMLDTVNAEIRSEISPYPVVETKTGIGGLSTPQVFEFPLVSNGVGYYITVTHRNSIATWSATPDAFEANYWNYNFTFDSTLAFGGNMIEVGTKWSIYTGDVNQDEAVDLSDIVAIFNDAAIFASGYIVTDLNCDTVADLTDIVYCFNNSAKFVTVIRP